MTTYNTGNPIGSTEVKDLFDNAQNLDVLTNDRTKRSHPDRLGVDRRTWYGMEQDFQDFLINSGYEQIGDYAAGLEITTRNQVFWKDGELYRAGAALDLPYTTTGDWLTEGALFVAVGDQVLRQDLAVSAGPTPGSSLVGYGGSTVQEALDETMSVTSMFTVAELSASGSPSDNAAAIAAAVDRAGSGPVTLPAGVFAVDPLALTTDATLVGQGASTVLRLADGAGGHLITASGNLTISDMTLDQNRQNNPDRLKSALSFTGAELYVRNVQFKNTMFAGIHIPLVPTTRVTVLDCNFSSMAEHSGVMGEQSQAINCRTTTDCSVTIRGGSVVHDIPADVDAAPGGFIFDGTAYQSVEVSGVTFRNIGQRKANNYIGSIDFYTGCRDCVVYGNRVFNYYYVPFKFQNCQRVSMHSNIVNGAADAAANQAVVFQNARDYQTAVTEFSCVGNVFLGTAQFTDAIYVQGDPDGLFDTERVVISGNVIRLFRYGINTSYVLNASMQGNDISLCSEGVYIRDVINGSMFSVTGGRIANCSVRGVAAIGVAGRLVNLLVSGVTLTSNTSFHVDASYAARLTVTGCTLSGSPVNEIRSENNGFAVVTGNNNGTATSKLSILTGTLKQAGNSWN